MKSILIEVHKWSGLSTNADRGRRATVLGFVSIITSRTSTLARLAELQALRT
jgi:hypothetical protein